MVLSTYLPIVINTTHVLRKCATYIIHTCIHAYIHTCIHTCIYTYVYNSIYGQERSQDEPLVEQLASGKTDKTGQFGKLETLANP